MKTQKKLEKLLYKIKNDKEIKEDDKMILLGFSSIFLGGLMIIKTVLENEIKEENA